MVLLAAPRRSMPTEASPMDCRSGAQQPNPAEPMTAASKKPGKSCA